MRLAKSREGRKKRSIVLCRGLIGFVSNHPSVETLGYYQLMRMTDRINEILRI